jgi:hypothetical protein
VANKTSIKSNSRKKSTKKATSRRTKSQLAKSQHAEDVTIVGEGEVSIDRRRTNRREERVEVDSSASAPQLERRKKVNRRRQIDPTTCERDYTDQEVEFMNALDDYKRKSGRMFPTCSEVLEVLRGLGYVKLSSGEMGALSIESPSSASAKPMPADWSASEMSIASEVTATLDGEAQTSC